MSARVLIVLTADVEDGNTGDPLWAEGQRLEVDPISARHYIRSGVAVLANDVDEAAAEEDTRAGLPAAAVEQLDRLDEKLAESEAAEVPVTDEAVAEVPPSVAVSGPGAFGRVEDPADGAEAPE